MKLLAAACGLFFLLSTSLHAAEPVSVQYGETLTLPRVGATAAYAIDSAVADASASEGVVRIRGVGVGRTLVIVVAGEVTEGIPIVVSPPPIVYPAGLLSADLSRSAQGGILETRFSSNPRQVITSADLRREDGARSEQFRLFLANYLEAAEGERFGIPQLLYRVATERREVALGDAMVAVSPLTISNTQLRGLHLRQDDWSFHGGFASSTAYQGAILATTPERALGITRRFRLAEGQSLYASLYHFGRGAEASLRLPTGFLGSLLYSTRKQGQELDSEIAFARGGVGGAFRYHYSGGQTHLEVDLKRRPYNLPALSMESQQGTFVDINFGAALSSRLNVAGSTIGSDYDMPGLRSRNIAASQRLIYSLAPGWSLTGGAAASRFSSGDDSGTVKKAIIPVGVTYTRPSFTASAEYQPTWDMEGRRGDAYSGSTSVSIGNLHGNVYYRRDVDLPTLQAFLAVTELHDLLERAGLLVTDVSQLVQYLRDSAFLIKLGLASDIQFNVAPSRDDVGINVEWAREGQRLTLSASDSKTRLVSGALRMRTETVTYSLHMTRNSEVIASASAVQVLDGFAGTDPVLMLTYRHRLESVPSLIFQRSGRIWGHVFRDDESTGVYDGSRPALPGVVVKLDDGRTVRTGADGFYEFANVRPGTHTVTAIVSSARPFAFTTDSPRRTGINAAADFGVTYLLGRVIGRVSNDAGTGIDRVLVTLQSAGGTRETRTNAEGQFSFSNLPDGPYWIATAADSYPPGYDIGNVTEDPVVIRSGEPVSIELFARALRSVSGTVVRIGTAVPAPEVGIEVSLPALKRTTRTNSSGHYRFLDLPAGTFTVELSDGDRKFVEEVVLTPQPVTLSSVNFSLPARTNPE